MHVSRTHAHTHTHTHTHTHARMHTHTHLWWSTERVSIENGLNHNKTLCNIFTIELVTVVGRLVWAVVEHLEKLRATQVKHKLREREREREHKVKVCSDTQQRGVTNLGIQWEVLCKLEGAGVILVVLPKLLTLCKREEPWYKHNRSHYVNSRGSGWTYQSDEQPVKPSQHIRTIILLWTTNQVLERGPHELITSWGNVHLL